MSELFDLPETPSPRLRWMRENDVHIAKGELPGDHAFYAYSGELDEEGIPDDFIGYGDTEDDAIVDWAKRNDVRLWNEEGAK